MYPNIELEAKYRFILDCFSEFHARTMEQSIITAIKPDINDLGTQVSFSFPSIDISTYTPSYDNSAHPITVYTRDGLEYNNYDSIRTARRALGISEGMLNNARNRLDYFIHCPTPNTELRIFDHTLNTILGTPLNSHLKLAPISGIVLESIPYGIIRAFHVDKMEKYGDYINCTEFAKLHDINS